MKIIKLFCVAFVSVIFSGSNFAGTQCKTVSTGSGDYLVSQRVCWYEYVPGEDGGSMDNFDLGNNYGDDTFGNLPTEDELNILIDVAVAEYDNCLSDANAEYGPCVSTRVSEIQHQYHVCAAAAVVLGHGNPKVAAGLVYACGVISDYDKERSPEVCLGQVNREKDKCRFNIG